MHVNVHLSLKTDCINMNPLPDFIGCIRAMRLWARKLFLITEVQGEREREKANDGAQVGSCDMAEGQGGWQMTNDFRWGCQL